MFKKREFKKHLDNYNLLDFSRITTWGKYSEDLARGKEGEDVVFSILSKYTNKIHQSVVMWAGNKRFTTEIDFIAEINGYLVLVEVKQWFGKLERNVEKNSSLLSYTNINGKYVTKERTDPIYAMGGYTKDFIEYLRPDKPKKNLQMKRFVVFTRDELVIGETYKNLDSSIVLCHCDDFEKNLKELSKSNNLDPYFLNKPLPTWDIYYDERDRQWHKCVVTTQEIVTKYGTYNVADIDSILLSNRHKGKSLIKLRDESFVKCVIDRRDIRLSGNPKYALGHIYRFIKFDKTLHD